MSTPPKHVTDRAKGICPSDANRPNGKQYTPSNGAEGDIFMSHWCHVCRHDRNEDCEILLQSLCHEEPAEWQYWDGKPICTKFEAKRKPAARVPSPAIVPGQLPLEF